MVNRGDVHQPSRELRPSQVTLKTVLTVCFGVLLVVALVEAVPHAVVSLTLIGAAVMIAVALDHAVGMLQRRRVDRVAGHRHRLPVVLGLVVAWASR